MKLKNPLKTRAFPGSNYRTCRGNGLGLVMCGRLSVSLERTRVSAVTLSTGLENEKNDQTGEITGKDRKGCASVRPYLFGAGSRKGARYSRGAVSLQRAAITDLNSRGARAKR